MSIDSFTTAAEPAHVIRDDAEALSVAAEFAASIAPGAIERDVNRSPAFDELNRLGQSGLLALTVPREFGGPDVSFATLAQVFFILGQADSAIAQVPQNHFVFVDMVRHEGTPRQKSLFLGEVLRGARFGNALSERGTRTTGEKKTRLSRDGAGDFRLNGKKYYCTGAYSAQWIPVMALDEQGRLVVAIVPRHAQGVEVTTDWTAMGQRSTMSGTTVLDDVKVPADHVFEHWKRYEAPHIFGASAQLLHAAIHVAVGAAALADAVTFITTRTRPYGEAGVERASDEPHLIKQMGELSALQHASEALLARAARSLDEARADLNADTAAGASIAVAEAKAFGGDTSVKVASDVFALAGTSSTDAQHGFDRHWRNVRTHTLHDPARWKYHHIGNYVLNGKRPPSSGLI